MGKIIFLTLAFYFLYWFLAHKTSIPKKYKWLGKSFFRYFWNVILLLTFLPTAISGILLYLGYTNRFLVDLHNQMGIVMVVVGILHLLARINYFTGRLKYPRCQ